MFGIGSTELLVILLVGLIVLGPKSLASMSRTIGKVVGEFRRVSTDFQRTLNAEAAAEEHAEKMAKMSEEEKAKQKQEDDADAKRAELLAARKEAALQKAKDAKEANKTAETSSSQAQAQDSVTDVPQDSPLAKAIQAAHAEAQAFEKSQEKKSTASPS